MGKAKGPKYMLPYRRLRERKTDYKLRRELLKAGKPFFIVRRSNNYIYISITVPEIGGDRTIVSVSSKILRKKYGWLNGLKNLPAAYLTGLIVGKKAIEAGIEEAVMNLGYAWSKKASIPYAAAMGAIEAGLRIPIGDKALVDMSRIRGEHIAEYARLLKEEDLNVYKRRFSRYLEAGIDPENIPSLFEEIKERILGDVDAE